MNEEVITAKMYVQHQNIRLKVKKKYFSLHNLK